MDFWKSTLHSPRYVVAPMVEASELAWRMLGRRHGAHLCYTPMWHSSVFTRDSKYRAEALQSCPEDRPLIVQFCANESHVFTEAALLAQDHCDAIDLNLGCPQAIARRGHYGAFLMDDWQLLRDMVRSACSVVKVPITCKIRVFSDVRRTVDYARMLESAGASLLTVHGRTRSQRGPLTGLANWEYIAAVRASVHVPMFANGNIQSLADVEKCIQETGVQGVMSAEGHLHNPAIFEGRNPPVWEMAEEYLTLADLYPCPTSVMRGHLFKLFQHLLALPCNFDVRQEIAKSPSHAHFVTCVQQLRDRYHKYHIGEMIWTEDLGKLKYSPWLCQPYERPSPEEHLLKLAKIAERDLREAAETEQVAEKEGQSQKRKDSNPEIPAGMSKKKMKKLQRNPKKGFGRMSMEKCIQCPNPSGLKCGSRLCKPCCRTKCYIEELDCPGHRILVKTKRETARAYSALSIQDKSQQQIECNNKNS